MLLRSTEIQPLVPGICSLRNTPLQCPGSTPGLLFYLACIRDITSAAAVRGYFPDRFGGPAVACEDGRKARALWRRALRDCRVGGGRSFIRSGGDALNFEGTLKAPPTVNPQSRALLYLVKMVLVCHHRSGLSPGLLFVAAAGAVGPAVVVYEDLVRLSKAFQKQLSKRPHHLEALTQFGVTFHFGETGKSARPSPGLLFLAGPPKRSARYYL